jgi:5-oxoprolinase (ATP-hydrolysing)/N-methylhydantoinase A
MLDDASQVVKTYDQGALEAVTRLDQVIEVGVGGGAGFGDPRDRAIAAVQADLDNGYITTAAATRIYGCVLDGTGHIDTEATTRQRGKTVAAEYRHARKEQGRLHDGADADDFPAGIDPG